MRPNKNISFASPFGIMLNEHNADHGVPAQTDGDSTLLRVIMDSLYNGKLGASGAQEVDIHQTARPNGIDSHYYTLEDEGIAALKLEPLAAKETLVTGGLSTSASTALAVQRVLSQYAA
ncbi:hypothetical protein OEZ86_002948 [Tetradesmus obliquus]|nr:hypothetical protein OEZ86_002948 [Tetradesmus obliquus]